MSATRDFMWDLRYKQLVDYKELHGNCEVPQKLGQLGRWVHRQRESKNKGFLSDDRVAKLDELGFVWRQKSCRPTDTWDERYLQLIKYKEIHGNCNVPQSYEEISGLGRWVNRQRTAKQKGELTDIRNEKLEAIGFSWNTKNVLWDVRFQELVNFMQRKGHCDVPYGWAENKELSKWVQKQRYLHTLKCRGSKSNLTDEREEKLNSLGFVWNASSTSWDTHYEALCAFKKKHGTCNVPRPYPQNPKLSNWVYNHRSEYSRKRRGLKHNLTAEREAKLNAIGFAWVLKQKNAESYHIEDDRDDELSNYKRSIDSVTSDDDRTSDDSVTTPPTKKRAVFSVEETTDKIGKVTLYSSLDDDQRLVASQLLNLKGL